MAKTVTPFDFAACSTYMDSLLKQTHVTYSAEQLTALTTLIEQLHTWNGALNLTAIKDVKQMVLLHVVDSAVVSPVLKILPLTVHTVADVGTGAGFPGLVLAILHPEMHFTLIDSVGKKLSFVRQMVAKLHLQNVELINKRCEDISHEPFDCIVSRAFAPLERMVKWCLPLLKADGRFVAMKANLEEEELNDVKALSAITGSNADSAVSAVTIDSIVPLQVPTLDATRQVVILKRGSTPAL